MIESLAGVLDRAPTSLSRAALQLAAGVARYGRTEERTLANLELALGDELDETARRRLAADVRRHAARQFLEWSRLAAGDRNRAWLERTVEVDGSI